MLWQRRPATRTRYRQRDPNTRRCPDQLAELTRQLEDARAQNESLKQQLASAAAAVAATSRELAPLQATDRYTKLLITSGDLCRSNLVSKAWHALHPTAAMHLWGLGNWRETCLHLWTLWPELRPPKVNEGGETSNLPMSDFEKCLIAKARMRRGFTGVHIRSAWVYVGSRGAFRICVHT